MSKVKYSLLIADGGKECLCVIKSKPADCLSVQQRSLLTERCGDYVVPSIHSSSVNCYFKLPIIDIDDLENFIEGNYNES
jgi:hypothetical protein